MKPDIPDNFDTLNIQEKIMVFSEIQPVKGLENASKVVFSYKVRIETWFRRANSWIGPRGQEHPMKPKEKYGIQKETQTT